MKHLYVFFQDHHVGNFQQDDDGRFSFSYDPAWLNNPLRFAVSFSMPLSQNSFGHRIAHAFFEGLLPEGDVREDIKRLNKIEDPFDMLRTYGGDCAGALTLHETKTWKTKQGPLPPGEIFLADIYQVIEEKASALELFQNETLTYLSLAGAQDKFTCVVNDHHFFIPRDGSPTSHIVKLPIWRHGVSESVYNEYFCMTLANTIGLPTPKCWVLDGPHPLFIIERYDRTSLHRSEKVVRLHQQDLCQAQGIMSSQKYESLGGPGISDNYHFLLKHITPRHRFNALEHFLKWIAFNLIIGNNDAHSKNISILMLEQEKYRLAPFYDLVSTAIYPKLKSQFSFQVGGRDVFSTIGANQIAIMEKTLGIKKNTFKEMLSQTAIQIQAEAPPLLSEFRARWPKANVFNKIEKLFQKRLRSLIRQRALS